MSREDFEAIAQHAKEKFDTDRKRFLSEEIAADDDGWLEHSEFHWSRTVSGMRLDYWPSRKKFQFKGRISRGDVYSFIKRQNLKGQQHDK